MKPNDIPEILEQVRQSWDTGKKAPYEKQKEIRTRTANEDLIIQVMFNAGRIMHTINDSDSQPANAIRIQVPKGMSREDIGNLIANSGHVISKHDNWHEFFTPQPNRKD